MCRVRIPAIRLRATIRRLPGRDPIYDARALAQQVFPLAVGGASSSSPRVGERRKGPAHACHALCRARVADELQRRRGTHIGEHLKIVLSIIDRQER